MLEEAKHDVTNGEISYRQEKRYLPMIEPILKTENSDVTYGLKKKGCYVISGGLGGIGQDLVNELLIQYEANVLILGRSKIEEKANKLRAMEALTGKVIYKECDFNDTEKLKKIVNKFVNKFGTTLDGIFHLAGTYHEKSLLTETEKSIDEILYPKVGGALAFEEIRKDYKDTSVIYFSSILTLNSAALTGAYTAANNFLNYFSTYQRNVLGAKSFSLAWSFWKNRGMSKGVQSNEFLKQKGFLVLEFEQGMNSILSAINNNVPEVFIGLDLNNHNVQLLLTEEWQKKVKNADTTQKKHSEYNPPKSVTEKKLVNIWQKLLKQSPIGIDDNYFEFGGTSLSAARMFAEIKKTFNKNLPLSTLLSFPTVQELAKIIDKKDDISITEKNLFSQIVEVQQGKGKPPFFCIPGAGSDAIVFRDLAKHMGEDQPFYGLQVKGLDATDIGEVELSVEGIARETALLIRNVQPHGPYFIGGHCFGGMLAYEVARYLIEQKEEVALLAMLDPLLGDEKSLDMFGYERFKYHLIKYWKTPLTTKLKYVFERAKNFSRNLLVKQRLNQSLAQVRSLYEKYEFHNYSSEITVFLAKDSYYKLYNDRDPRKVWSKYSSRPVAYIEVEGNHDSIINGTEVEGLAKKLAKLMEDRQ